jgi:hypothetical protein
VGGTTGASLGGPSAGMFDAWLARYHLLVSTRYCTPAQLNSTGRPGALHVTGSNALQPNDPTLLARELPQHSFGHFLTSRSQGLVNGAGCSQGDLCVGGFIGRYSGPGQIKNSGASGSFSLAIDFTRMPQPFGNVVAQAGQTWHFQAWYRDANPTSTSNFTDAVRITLQ